ncbi:sensor histidine kinase [Micromonospora sp. NPDC003197]
MDQLRCLPRSGRTIRSRITVLYAVVFLVSGAGLLAITNLLAGSQVTQVAPGGRPPGERVDLAAARTHIEQLEAQLADLRATQSRQLLVGSLIALAVMAGISILLGRLLAGRVLRPLRTITAATQRISAENLHRRLAVSGPTDEIKNLADTIDGLLERLETSFAAQRRFVANASHELRTPLTTMRASLDVALAKPEPVPPQTLALTGRLRTELDRVDGLLEGFLVLARAQHGVLPDRAPVPLGGLLSEAVTARAADVTAKDLTVEVDIRDRGWTRGNPTLLARAVANVVDNTIVHNQAGGWLRVLTRTRDAWAQLIVETAGPPLDPAQVARLTEPFQRLAADRTGSETGSGLGLSIVAAIVAAHRGRLELHARSEGGLRVTISVPAEAAPSSVVT